MNKIEFKIIKKDDRAWEGEYYAARIFINNTDLIDTLAKFEKPFAQKENQENIAGSYEGLSPEYLYENLTGKPIFEDNKTIILECTCGCEGCWDFLVEIKENNREIIWTNFENIHRGRESHNFWDYSTFSDLKFDKTEYLQEISKLKFFIENQVESNNE